MSYGSQAGEYVESVTFFATNPVVAADVRSMHGATVVRSALGVYDITLPQQWQIDPDMRQIEVSNRIIPPAPLSFAVGIRAGADTDRVTQVGTTDLAGAFADTGAEVTVRFFRRTNTPP